MFSKLIPEAPFDPKWVFGFLVMLGEILVFVRYFLIIFIFIFKKELGSREFKELYGKLISTKKESTDKEL